MLALALLLLGCCALQSSALPAPALVQYQAKDELGQYRYGYSGGPSAKQEERTLDGVTRGSYSYIDGNGIVQTRSYEADDIHGFRVVGTDISAPTGVSKSGTILSSTGPPVYDHTFIKTYQPAPYKSGYDDVQSFSGNEISISPASPLYGKTYSPYSLEYLKNPYRYRVPPQPTKYYQQHYISPNSLDITPLSSVGIRVPTSYSQPIAAVAYSESGVQSTVTPPTIYTNEVPVPVSIRESYTPNYHAGSSKIVSSYSPYRANVVAVTNPNPAPISYLDAAPGSFAEPTVAISSPSPTVVAYTRAVPAAAVATAQPPVAVYDSTPAVSLHNSVPAVSYSTPAVSLYNSAPAVSYSTPAVSLHNSVPAVSYSTPAVSLHNSAPAVSYSTPAVSLHNSVATVYDSTPAVSVHNSVPAVSYSTPLGYEYYPTTSSFTRYASAAPFVTATIYEPAGGYLTAKPIPLQEAIAAQYHAQDELGQYRYGYSNINSAKEESKTIDGVTRGSFSYVDANGVLQSRTYVSDDVNGFRVIGTDIPKDPNGHVNLDAIPSDHVASAVAPEVVPVHSQPPPATVYSQNIVDINSPVIISTTHSPFSK